MAAPSHAARPGTAAYDAFAITPSDSTDLAKACYGLYIGVTGNVQVTMWSGNVVLFSNLAAGWHPIACLRVWSTNTTATSIVGIT